VTNDLAELAEEAIILGHRLTPAHQVFLLSLPMDGSWRKTTSWDFERHGKNAFRGFGKTGLVDGYYREEMRHRLTEEGRAVAAALRARQQRGVK
jgi:hypothetical protein